MPGSPDRRHRCSICMRGWDNSQTGANRDTLDKPYIPSYNNTLERVLWMDEI